MSELAAFFADELEDPSQGEPNPFHVASNGRPKPQVAPELPTVREPGFTPLEEFAAVNEPGAEPLVSATIGGTVIPSSGLVIVYGAGGAGKTTLVLDASFQFASGSSWLGLLEPARQLRIAIVENEGPRPEFRKK